MHTGFQDSHSWFKYKITHDRGRNACKEKKTVALNLEKNRNFPENTAGKSTVGIETSTTRAQSGLKRYVHLYGAKLRAPGLERPVRSDARGCRWATSE